MGDSSGETSPEGDEVYRLVEEAKELQETAASLISRISREEDTLRQRVASLDSRINSLRSKRDDDLKEELIRARYILSEGDAAAFLPDKSQGRFLRMFLGPINVRASRKDIRLKVKDEYNSFRNCIFVPLFAIIAAYAEVLDLGRMSACSASSTLSGMVVVPVHRSSIEGKHP